MKFKACETCQYIYKVTIQVHTTASKNETRGMQPADGLQSVIELNLASLANSQVGGHLKAEQSHSELALQSLFFQEIVHFLFSL